MLNINNKKGKGLYELQWAISVDDVEAVPWIIEDVEDKIITA